MKLAKPPAPSYPVISQEIISEWREGGKLSQPPSPKMYNHVPPLGGGCKSCERGAVFSAPLPLGRTAQSGGETTRPHLDPVR